MQLSQTRGAPSAQNKKITTADRAKTGKCSWQKSP